MVESGSRLPGSPGRLHFLVLFCLVFDVAVVPGLADHPFEDDISKFEQQDRRDLPDPGQVLFLGSSSIRLWDLARSFPKLDAVNRGFGGSEISDSIYFFDRIVIPYRPRTIVFYAGDNDLANGKSPEQVAGDFRAFASKVRESLPSTRIIYISVKPSPARWHLRAEIVRANQLIHAFAAENRFIQFLDVYKLMVGTNGKPRPELFAQDNLHLNENGYSLWTQALKAILE